MLKLRLSLVPLGGLLVSVRQRQDRRFGKMRAADLKTDGQARSRESAGNGKARHAIHVESDVVIAATTACPGRGKQGRRCLH